MTINDIIRLDDALTDEGQLLMLQKNSDYAGSDADPLRNFQQFGALGVLVRLSDKIARLRTYVENRTYAVKNESFRDTILDARNYLTILLALCPMPEQDPPQVLDPDAPLQYVAKIDPVAWHGVDPLDGRQRPGNPVAPCLCGCKR